MLEYLNLAMNNIERVENTECLEKLEKLDLTLNFIGEITSLEILQHNKKLKSLYLMGNPCTEYEYYQDYIIAILPHIEFLDGMPIEKSKRIQAIQDLEMIRHQIVIQENKYLSKRQLEKIQNIEEIKNKAKEYDDPNLDLDTKRQRFYNSVSKHNPEYRKESSRFREYLEEMDEELKKTNLCEDGPRYTRKITRYFDDNDKPLNINEAQIEFQYDDSDDENLVIEIMTFKHMETSWIDLDVQPTYLRYVENCHAIANLQQFHEFFLSTKDPVWKKT